MHRLLTDKINSGKSTKLWKYFQDNRNKLIISGWISLPYFENNEKTGYDIVFIKESSSSEKRRLARIYKFDGGTKWRKFWFDQNIFKEAASFDFGKADLFVIDEVGPLELDDKKGFWPLLYRIYENHDNTITVLRNEACEPFLKIFKKNCPFHASASLSF